jgi:uncharacterized protein YbjT (DUF2867 family)
VRRALFTAQDPKTLQQAFARLKPNMEMRPLYEAAVARQRRTRSSISPLPSRRGQDGPFHPMNFVAVEEAMLTSGMEYSFLHPTVFFQNYAQGWPKVVETGVLAEPWSIDSRFSRVDYRDVAEVTAIALTEDQLLYGTLELCSEGHLDRKDVAAIIGKVLGRDIKADRIDPQKAAAGAGGQAAGLKKMFDWYDARGLQG